MKTSMLLNREVVRENCELFNEKYGTLFEYIRELNLSTKNLGLQI